MAKTALLSVSDKSGLEAFARSLVEDHGYRLLSTGGTARLLREAGLPVTDVSDHTGFPEMMDGRVKTLHPKIHGGLLARRDDPAHMAAAKAHGIDPIDLVAVNLYPFEATVAKPDVSEAEAVENIDIGGPSMLRSAAKNAASVTVVCDPADYETVLAALAADDAGQLATLRRQLAAKVYSRTAAYDAAITTYLTRGSADLPAIFNLGMPRVQALRYGENPHQAAALYGDFPAYFDQLQGKALSFNNLIDITAAAGITDGFDRPTVAIVKHTNPCGVGSADDLRQAWEKAFATDRQAPFGGIIALNRPCDGAVAEAIREIWCEIIIAPAFDDDARARFARKKNLRLMIQRQPVAADSLPDIRSVAGGILVQARDRLAADPATWQVVTDREPTEEEWAGMRFGWQVVRHVKSNAICYCKGERTLGIGAGQMSRVDSSRLAIRKAGEAGLDLAGSVLCSDALIPFADGLEAAARAGATACVQTGGSMRDDAVIAAANKAGIAMVLTGVRHFKH
ncbi:MAG: bifunctional phosphoribosylaminoimidazolecarboxamide formyltransferase/IMP cyclohydrolase [Opitutales bacterium]